MGGVMRRIVGGVGVGLVLGGVFGVLGGVGVGVLGVLVGTLGGSVLGGFGK